MNTSSSSSFYDDESLHEDIADIFIPGLDFDQETLALADEFIKDLDSSVPPSSSDNEPINNLSDNNHNNDNIVANNSILTNSPEHLDLHPTHSLIFPLSSSSYASNLDIPLSPLNDQPSHSQSHDSHSPVASPSYPSNINVPLEPLNHQPIQFHNEHTTPVASPSHYTPPNAAPSDRDVPDSYWKSNGCVNEFFNFDYPNNEGNGSVVSANPSPAAPVLNIYAASDTNTTSQPNSNDPLLPSGSVEKAQYKQVKKGQSCQRGRFFPAILPIDNTHSTKQKKGTYQFWFFILQLLMNPSNKSIIIWTGHQRFFRVIDKNALCKLWSTHLGNSSDGNWKTAERNIRSCGAKGIMMPVPSKTHKGRNEDGLFGFMIEPSHYVGMTREELDKFIVENCETAPLPSSQAPSNASAPVIHNQPPLLQHQLPLQHFQPQFAQFMNNVPYFPDYYNYHQQPPVMHSQIHPTNYRYSPY